MSTQVNLPFKPDKTWTLFLDRDGVINLHYPNDYVKNWSEFIFLEGAVEAIFRLSKLFRRVIVVTNQQGVGKGLMSAADLNFIHEEMRKAIKKEGGVIHAIYAATDLASPENNLRKPGIGMALQAKKDFEGLDFSKSIMVGDSVTDLMFGRNAGMKTIFIGNFDELSDAEKQLADVTLNNLSELVAALENGDYSALRS